MKSFCIINMNEFGETLARTLAAENRDVLIIDADANLVSPLADLVTNAVIGDPTSEAVLRAAGVSDYECAIVCDAANINDCLLTCILLKEIGVRTVIARAGSNAHRKVLLKIGVDSVVFPEQDFGERLAFTLARDKVSDYMEFHGYKLVELAVPKAWYGKTLLQLAVRNTYDVTVIAVTSADGDVDVSPNPVRVFAPGERMTLIGADAAIDICIQLMGQ